MECISVINGSDVTVCILLHGTSQSIPATIVVCVSLQETTINR